VSDIQDESNLYRDHVIAWAQDLGRSIDYLETRPDIDADRVGYFGVSWGGVLGGIMTAVEPRIEASVLVVGGLEMQATQPMADPFNFLPRITVPTLMLNGRYDSFFPLETSIMPFFENLGTPDEDKKIIITDSNHFVLAYEANLAIAESLDWYDRYLGVVE
jgi:dienelactone hydrolase